MNQLEIQKNITSFIPEFDGNNSNNELTRFLGTANCVYDSLTTDDERKIFNKLIQFRLTGDAYARISIRCIDEFSTLKKLLNNIYSKTYSLEELENQFLETKQNYGETIRNYGFRLSDALEKYKNGYKRKYKLANLDDTYINHLNSNSVRIFKRGINNTILKEKIATSIAKNLDEIIDETETMEIMLLTTTTPTSQVATQQSIQTAQPSTTQKFPRNINPIICNYCSKPNHTYDRCRTRIFTEQRQQQTPNQYNQNNSQQQYTFQGYNPQNQSQVPNYTNRVTQAEQQNFSPKYQPPVQINYNRPPNSNNLSNSYSPQTQGPNYTTYRQPRNSVQPQEGPIKYCSFCKTTKGHTFEECRSKLLPRNQLHYNDPPSHNRRPQNTDIVNTLHKMEINTLTPQMQLQQQDQENYNGSSQQ